MARIQFSIRGFSTNVTNEQAGKMAEAFSAFKDACQHEFMDVQADDPRLVLDPEPEPEPVDPISGVV